MMRFTSSTCLLICVLMLLGVHTYGDRLESQKAELGRLLFFDTNLSLNRSASCASCHNPASAFADDRWNETSAGESPGAVSLGADGRSLGNRNAPALTYIGLTPDFSRLEDGGFLGGFFLDGRADTLAIQAQGPLLNHRELGLADVSMLAQRLREIDYFAAAVVRRDGVRALAEDDELAGDASEALAEFQRSAEFAAFDSKYDRYLAGDYQMTPEEAIGRELFFSDLTNCRLCHLASPNRVSTTESFTSFEYHNIGVPVNPRLLAIDGDRESPDPGLAVRPEASPADAGKFRVPSLRNVAVTAPYMHNGAFLTLEAAILFYGRHLVDQSIASVNPETDRPWRAPEIAATVEQERLVQGQPLDHTRTRQLIAFLKTLTDRRYEYLLDR